MRDILDPRSTKVKVSYCDPEMGDKPVSIKKMDCFLISDILQGFSQVHSVLARNLYPNRYEETNLNETQLKSTNLKETRFVPKSGSARKLVIIKK